MNQLSQIKYSEANEKDFKRLYDVFKRLRKEIYELKYRNVNSSTTEVQIHEDASFAHNKDLSSQLGYIILIVDRSGNRSILIWSSK